MPEERQMISCFKGLAPCSFPKSWLDEFNYDRGFAVKGREAFINFGPHGAFGVKISHGAYDAVVIQHARRLTTAEAESIGWGEFCTPWESYDKARLFGISSDVIRLDEVPEPEG